MLQEIEEEERKSEERNAVKLCLLAHSFVPKDHSSPAQLPLHIVVFFVVRHGIQHLHVAILMDATARSFCPIKP
jgi:hypothetical protein